MGWFQATEHGRTERMSGHNCTPYRFNAASLRSFVFRGRGMVSPVRDAAAFFKSTYRETEATRSVSPIPHRFDRNAARRVSGMRRSSSPLKVGNMFGPDGSE